MSEKMVYTLVGFDDLGSEIARIKGLSREGIEAKRKEFAYVTIIESEVVVPRVYCDVIDCGRVARTVMCLTEEQRKMCEHGKEKRCLPLCAYHSSGARVYPSGVVVGKLGVPTIPLGEWYKPVEDKQLWKGISPAPDYLCVKFCPSFWKGECRSCAEPESGAERKKRYKGYTICGKNYTVLCIEDDWWIAGLGEL